MIKEALQYIVGLNEAHITTLGGQNYTDKDLHRVSYNPKAIAIKLSTLSSLVEYIKADIDTMYEKMIVQVISPLEVRLISQLDHDRIREIMVQVTGSVPEFAYGRYMDHESFLIALQSKFVPGDDRDLLLKFAGTVENGTVASYSDDGVSQKATIKKGIAGKEDTLVPNPVRLRPYRTFLEVEQPESLFVFRMKDEERSGVQCAIFEADGGAWNNAAMDAIKNYLSDELEGLAQFTVIS